MSLTKYQSLQFQSNNIIAYQHQKWPEIIANYAQIYLVPYSLFFIMQVLRQLFRLLTTQMDNCTEKNKYKSESLACKALTCHLLYRANTISGKTDFQVQRLCVQTYNFHMDFHIKMSFQREIPEDFTKYQLPREAMIGMICSVSAACYRNRHPQSPPLSAFWYTSQSSPKQHDTGSFQMKDTRGHNLATKQELSPLEQIQARPKKKP